LHRVEREARPRIGASPRVASVRPAAKRRMEVLRYV
jgi:hypothetical protein